jgi:hypothetical protein
LASFSIKFTPPSIKLRFSIIYRKPKRQPPSVEPVPVIKLSGG